MPLRVTVEAGVPQAPRNGFSTADLHRLACFLLEDEGEEAHLDQDKPFSVQPPLVFDNGRRVEIVLNSLSDDLSVVDRLESRLHGRDGRSANIGVRHPLIDPVIAVSGMTWIELASVEPRISVSVRTLSPILFRRNGRSLPLPDPRTVHSRLVHRWNLHVPDDRLLIPDAAGRDIGDLTSLRSFRIESAAIPRYSNYTGFTGTMTFSLHTDDRLLQRAFSALWWFSGFAGLGSMTAHGLGAIVIEG